MSYLQPQSLGSVLGNTCRIYCAAWTTIFLIAALPIIPLRLLSEYAEGPEAATVIISLIEFLVGVLVSFPLAVAISEVCIGLTPNTTRAFRRAFARPGRVLGAYTVVVLLQIAALVALIIPALVVTALYMFVVPIVILEQIGGRRAFKRSCELGRGFYLRNLGTFLLVVVLIFFLIGLVDGVATLLMTAVHGTGLLLRLALALLGAILAPLLSIPIILLYYDMRVRKEGYGVPQLMEDLK